jgi:hypothetical protein
MWKKLENFTSSRPDPDVNETPNLNGMLDNKDGFVDPWLDEQDERSDFEATPQMDTGEPESESSEPQSGKTPQLEPAPSVTLGAYSDAVKKFTKSASAFIEQLPLLAEAREAYEEATRASAELRRVLDAGDENLRTLMSHLEQMANIHLVNVPGGKPTTDKRKVEGAKLGPVRAGEEIKGAMKRFP